MPKNQHGDLRRAVKAALSSVSRLEAMAIRYVNRGEDVIGKELTRTEFRVLFTDQANVLRKQLREVLEMAVARHLRRGKIRQLIRMIYVRRAGFVCRRPWC